MRAALEEARARDNAVVLLFGDPASYRRFGFEPGVTLGVPNPVGQVLPDGHVIVEENLLVAPLDDRARPLSGALRTHPALSLPVEADDGGL
jgi:predicted N-acetyltransferase YhbS